MKKTNKIFPSWHPNAGEHVMQSEPCDIDWSLEWEDMDDIQKCHYMSFREIPMLSKELEPVIIARYNIDRKKYSPENVQKVFEERALKIMDMGVYGAFGKDEPKELLNTDFQHLYEYPIKSYDILPDEIQNKFSDGFKEFIQTNPIGRKILADLMTKRDEYKIIEDLTNIIQNYDNVLLGPLEVRKALKIQAMSLYGSCNNEEFEFKY